MGRTRCKKCRKPNPFPIVCSACNKGYCSSCIQVERHDCINMDKKLDEQMKLYSDDLMSKRTISQKIQQKV